MAHAVLHLGAVAAPEKRESIAELRVRAAFREDKAKLRVLRAAHRVRCVDGQGGDGLFLRLSVAELALLPILAIFALPVVGVIAVDGDSQFKCVTRRIARLDGLLTLCRGEGICPVLRLNHSSVHRDLGNADVIRDRERFFAAVGRIVLQTDDVGGVPIPDCRERSHLCRYALFGVVPFPITPHPAEKSILCKTIRWHKSIHAWCSIGTALFYDQPDNALLALGVHRDHPQCAFRPIGHFKDRSIVALSLRADSVKI